MPPKKREKDNEVSKSMRIDQLQADHELFLQAFEKPTQIYRYLKTRNQLSPIFLARTLSYMRQQRMSRSHKSRKGFKVDNMLAKIQAARIKDPAPPSGMADFLSLTFLGYYDKSVESRNDAVKVETLLVKVCHKKRKDVTCPVTQLTVGQSDVVVNPPEDHPPSQVPIVSIPTDHFKRSKIQFVKSYTLVLKITHSTQQTSNTPSDSENGEPGAKRRRREDASKTFVAEMVIYDRHHRCLLVAGDYDLGVNEIQTPSRGSPKKHSSWENAIEVHVEGSNPFDAFKNGPILKLRLNWSNEPINGFIDRPRSLQSSSTDNGSGSNKENATPEGTSSVGPMRRRSDSSALQKVSVSGSQQGSDPSPPSSSTSGTPQPPSQQQQQQTPQHHAHQQHIQIVYQFLYNNNSRQQTEACDDLHCPWCAIDCGTLYALLKHLKLSHARFCFTYVPIPNGARVDVSINECFDGSYSGNALDVIAQPPGLAFSRDGPVRRTSITNILVCRPKRTRPTLSEFLEPDDPDCDNQRSYMNGHNRLYHHTTTCLPVYPKEMETDSEGENDPPWLQKKTMMMIDEFTDVNEGEKELMKMWNLHVMKHGFVGDCQIPVACELFLEAKGREILMKNLYRNFVLHMCSLFDFGLMSAVGVYTTLQKLQEIAAADELPMSTTTAVPSESQKRVKSILEQAWHAQRERWCASRLTSKVVASSDHFSGVAAAPSSVSTLSAGARSKSETTS